MLPIAENRKIANSGIPHCLGYTVNGLVHLPPSKTRLALLAFALSVRFGLSLREAAQLCCVGTTYVAAVSRLLPAERAQLIDGPLTLSDVVSGRARNGHKRSNCPGLEELLVAANPAERAAAARSLGPATIWDQMIEPLLNERPAPAAECATTPAADSTGSDCTVEQLLEALR